MIKPKPQITIINRTQEEMETNNMWIKQDLRPEVFLHGRYHGYNYVLKRAPNKWERVEMIYRSLGAASDWNLEEIRKKKKQKDLGNKYRILKNFYRFVKHPIGYTYWKTRNYRSQRAHIWFVTALMAGIFTFKTAYFEVEDNKKTKAYMLRSGQNFDGDGLGRVGYANQLPATQNHYWKMQWQGKIKSTNLIAAKTIDQPMRKYFELRKRYNKTDLMH